MFEIGLLKYFGVEKMVQQTILQMLKTQLDVTKSDICKNVDVSRKDKKLHQESLRFKVFFILKEFLVLPVEFISFKTYTFFEYINLAAKLRY